MRKYKNYEVHASHHMITLVAEISDLIGQFYCTNMENGSDEKNIQIAVEKLKYKKMTTENSMSFFRDFKTWKADSFEDFMQAANFLFSNDQLKYRKIEAANKICSRGLSRITEIKNSPPTASLIFQYIDKKPYHPLIRCSLFTWLMLKTPIFDDQNVNSLMAGLWQNIILFEWKSTLYQFIVQDCFWMMDLIIECNHTTVLLEDDPSKFVELNLNTILKVVKRENISEKFLSMDSISKAQVNANNTEDKNNSNIKEKGATLKGEFCGNIETLTSKMINEKQYSIQDLLALIDMKHRGNFCEKYLNPALNLGVIKRTIPDKPTSKNQRYILNVNNI